MKSLLVIISAYLIVSLAQQASCSIFGPSFMKQELGSVEKAVKGSFIKYLDNARSLSKSAVRQMSIRQLTFNSLFVNPQKHEDILSDAFQWKSCGPVDQLVDIHNLSIKPSPLFFPGRISFGFDIVFHDDIPQTAQITAAVTLVYRRSSSEKWITIPCIGNIGTCTYDDLCSLSQGIVCPDELKQRGIPCTCPFNKGEYKLPGYDVEVDASVFIPGDYGGQVVLTDAGKGPIACYQVFFSVE